MRAGRGEREKRREREREEKEMKESADEERRGRGRGERRKRARMMGPRQGAHGFIAGAGGGKGLHKLNKSLNKSYRAKLEGKSCSIIAFTLSLTFTVCNFLPVA